MNIPHFNDWHRARHDGQTWFEKNQYEPPEVGFRALGDAVADYVTEIMVEAFHPRMTGAQRAAAQRGDKVAAAWKAIASALSFKRRR